MKRILILGGTLLLLGSFAAYYFTVYGERPHLPAENAPDADELSYSFSVPGTLNESGIMRESSSPYWWLNSGGRLIIEDGIGRTIQGSVSLTDRWRKAYARTNAEDTDKGSHPQNIFRLISRNTWTDVRFEGRFRVDAVNLSESPARNESNGIFLMSRYADESNFYYAGLRVDGDAVIKKKYKGEYYTLAQTHVIQGSYDRAERPNLLPHGEWVDLRADTFSTPQGVMLRLFLRDDRANTWREILSATDVGGETPVLVGPAYVGVRSDFMDLSFDAFFIEELKRETPPE